MAPSSIGGKRVGADVDLICHEPQCRLGDGLARVQEPAGVTKAAKLEGIAKLIVPAAPAVDGGQVGPTQGPVPDQLCLVGWQGKHGLELRFGERAASWHGKVSQLRCRLIATVRAQ